MDWINGKETLKRTALATGCALLASLAAPTQAQESYPLLPETVITASRIALPGREVGASVTVITEEDLERRGIRVVSDALREVPGLSVRRSGPAGAFTQIGIRGAEGNHTLVLIDGIEVNNPSGGSEYDFANLLNTEIARIEVLRGPQSALYGSDAIGGVINIVTRTPEAGGEARLRGEGGSFATNDVLASLAYGDSRFHLSGTVDRFETNGVSVAAEENGNTEEDPYENVTLHLKAGFRPLENLAIEAVGRQISSENEIDNAAAVVGAVDSPGLNDKTQRYARVGATLELLGGDWTHRVNAAYTKDDSDFEDGSGNVTFVSNGRKTKYDYQSDLEFMVPGLAFAEHGLTVLFEHETDEQVTDSAFSGRDVRNIETNSYAGEYRLGLFDRLFLSAGLRYDDNDKLFDDATTYRLTAAYLVEETATRLHGSYGKGVKNPTLFELFGFTPTFVGNPDLSPEESSGWDAGVEQHLFGGRASLDVTYFNNRISDLIQGGGISALNAPGTSRIQGVEVSAAARPLDRLDLSLSYTFTDAEDSAGFRLIRRARHKANFDANYRFALFGRESALNLNLTYVGERQDQVFLSFFPLDTRQATLDDYTLISAKVSHRLNDQVEIFLRGENLLDEDYQEIFGFGQPGLGVFAGITAKLGPL